MKKYSLFIPLLFVFLIASQAQSAERQSYFEKISSHLLNQGDEMGAELIRELGHFGASIPRELSPEIKTFHNNYSERYEELRSKLKTLFLDTSIPSKERWRIDRAEAALHFVAYELEQERFASIRDVNFYLNDAAWILSGMKPTASSVESSLPPEIDFFSDREMIVSGETVLLSWRIKNAETAFLNSETIPLEGKLIERPIGTTYYYLQAVGRGARSEAGVIVAVSRPKPIPPPRIWIAVEPEMVLSGNSVMVRWRSTNADSVILDGETVALNGRKLIRPDNTRKIHAIANGTGGTAATTFEVKVIKLPKRLADTTTSEKEEPVIESAIADSINYESSETYSSMSNSETKFIIQCKGTSMILNAENKDKLKEISNLLEKDSTLRLIIVGYTDDKGSDESNMRYSLKRANRARDYFCRRFRISRERIETKGRGSAEPILPNRNSDGSVSKEGIEANRRVEILIVF